MIKDNIHKNIVDRWDQVSDWFAAQQRGLHFPFYASFDLRDSGFKVVPVDANLFPAGFNNICDIDKENSIELVANYLKIVYPDLGQNIVLLAEEHTKNLYYWENVRTLADFLRSSGKSVTVTMPRSDFESMTLTTSAGHEVTIDPVSIDDGKVFAKGNEVDLVICNNDFSEPKLEWLEGLRTRINPPPELGWHRRRKNDFFDHYNKLASEFAKVIDVDPWVLTVETQSFGDFDIGSEESRSKLADQVDNVIGDLKSHYKENNVEAEPFVFVKNSSGTYGLGVTQAKSGDDIRNWTYKARKKMKAVKGGGSINEVIVQEGVPTTVQADGETAEPAIYMIGCELAGGFLRTHGQKGPEENLNSPGAVYKRLCVSDLNISVSGHPLENVYGWVARLGMLALGQEISATKYQQ